PAQRRGKICWLRRGLRDTIMGRMGNGALAVPLAYPTHPTAGPHPLPPPAPRHPAGPPRPPAPNEDATMKPPLSPPALAARLPPAVRPRAAPLPPDGPVPDVAEHYIDRRLRGQAVRPAAAADDATLLRRLTLDLAGRIPTAAEARAFLADTAPDKRLKL